MDRRGTRVLASAAVALSVSVVPSALSYGATVEPVYSGRITKIFVDSMPSSVMAVKAGGLSRSTSGFSDPGWYLTQSAAGVELLFRVDRQPAATNMSCALALSAAGTELFRSPAMPVQALGFSATLESADLAQLTSPLGVKDTGFHVDCGDNGSATWTMPLTVLPVLTPGFDGVSVNDGADFTNAVDVVLNVGTSELADKVRVSNDGGFAPSRTQEFSLTSQGPIAWKLVELAAERIPRTVYVKFHDPIDGWQKQTYTDDIILDTVKPQVLSASLSGSGVATLAGPRMVRVKAKDNKSGLASIQVSAGKPKKKAKIVKFRKTVPAPKSGIVYVRVRDGAGNWSSWRRAG